MRPATLSDACQRFREGQPWDIAMGDFLQQFYGTPTTEGRARMLADEPPSLDLRHDALVGAIAEYLFKRWTPDHPPGWIGDRGRYLDRPWFPHAHDDPALMEYLTFASPAEFKSRNVMTDAEPLRRANMPRTVTSSLAEAVSSSARPGGSSPGGASSAGCAAHPACSHLASDCQDTPSR